MYWINYIIKTIIRRLVYIFIKPKYIIIFLIIINILLFLANSSFAVYQGDDTYTDPNNTVKIAYDTINNDLINRMSNSTSNSNNSLQSELKTGLYDYYCYYGDRNGSSMIGSSTFNTQILYILLYPKNSETGTSLQNNYQGITTNIRTITNGSYLYGYRGNNCSIYDIPESVEIPTILISYWNSDLVSFLNNSSSEETSEIVGALENQTQATQEQTNTIKNQTEAMTNTTFDDTSVSIDTSSSDEVSYDAYSGFFTTIFNNFNDSFSNDSVETISIPIPNSDETIDITSDIVSSHIGSLASLINVFWYAIFGYYAFKFCNNLIVKIKDGSLLNGLSSTDVITDSMM